MLVQLRYFAAVREKLGREEESLEILNGCTVRQLLETLAEKDPGLRPLLRYLRVAVNQEMVRTEHILRAGDEVALIPPVAGGSECLCVRDAPIDVGEAVRALAGDGVGGIAAFVGVVRRQSGDRVVRQLRYEAYRE
ncbi:MAG: molybdopterin converting factor subunit 1, partial [Bryobacteraceae bacterium]